MTLDELLLLGEGGTIESIALDGGGRRTVIRGRRFVGPPWVEAGEGDVRFEECAFFGNGVGPERDSPLRPDVIISACVFHLAQPAL